MLTKNLVSSVFEQIGGLIIRIHLGNRSGSFTRPTTGRVKGPYSDAPTTVATSSTVDGKRVAMLSLLEIQMKSIFSLEIVRNSNPFGSTFTFRPISASFYLLLLASGLNYF